MDVINLTKKLVSIPSFVDSGSNEGKVGEFLYQYLKGIDWLKVKKQKVDKNRFNVIATDGQPVKLLLIGHIDTVQSQKEWQTNPFSPVLKNGKLFGLGASDMKGGLACMVKALEKIKPTNGLMVLFYIDEEYDFKGMKKFIKEYQEKIKPELIVSADGGDLEISNGCRGIIEINFKVEGKSGHASQPESGKNAIKTASQAVKQLENKLKKYSNPTLGKSSCNLSYLKGGLNQGLDKNGEIKLGREGNIIPDYAEFVIDIRPASVNLNANAVIKIIKNSLKENGCQLIEAKVRHDMGLWLTPKQKIRKVTSLVNKPKFVNIGDRGYIDIQMLCEAFNQVPCVGFGPGESKMAHQANEYIKISSLIKAEKFFTRLLRTLVQIYE